MIYNSKIYWVSNIRDWSEASVGLASRDHEKECKYIPPGNGGYDARNS